MLPSVVVVCRDTRWKVFTRGGTRSPRDNSHFQDEKLLREPSLSEALPAINGSRSLGSQSARRILDHVGHDECTLQEHTEIAAHILKHGSCYIVACLAQAKSCQAVRLQCISFISHRLDWVPSVLTRRGADDIAGHPRFQRNPLRYAAFQSVLSLDRSPHYHQYVIQYIILTFWEAALTVN
ncbi:hypothetical protein F2P81_004763 [Scophthalmus maximus]|uniref:Uncharacterized protein n=1 Tax=Scophthalmus maximus TaxID=52904 RepID=A0A6A4T7A9_SCOMX|nr:hypothetical protein F2P81_004763 [Scophthalmus maximus]